MVQSACFVTPSYASDFERCRLLVESREHCAPDLQHYIVVDPQDLPLFRSLGGPKTEIVDARALLDDTFHKVPGGNGWWFNLRTPPVRGWITQQFRKLAMPRIVDHDILINVDSDVVFIRRFTAALLFDAGRLGLFDVDYRNAEIERWAATGAALVGDSRPAHTNNYVGMLIPWWRANVVALTDRIEAVHGRAWQHTLARQRSFSEYMTYGGYVRHHIGLAESGHFSDGRMLVQTSWHKRTDCEEGLADLFASAPPEAVAVMVHSKDGVAPDDYRRLVEQAWRDIG